MECNIVGKRIEVEMARGTGVVKSRKHFSKSYIRIYFFVSDLCTIFNINLIKTIEHLYRYNYLENPSRLFSVQKKRMKRIIHDKEDCNYSKIIPNLSF